MHQYLFYIGDFPVRAYGLVLSLSIILASSVAYFLAKQDGRWHDHIPDMCIYSGMAGLLGARLWDVFFFDFERSHKGVTALFAEFIINIRKRFDQFHVRQTCLSTKNGSHFLPL